MMSPALQGGLAKLSLWNGLNFDLRCEGSSSSAGIQTRFHDPPCTFHVLSSCPCSKTEIAYSERCCSQALRCSCHLLPTCGSRTRQILNLPYLQTPCASFRPPDTLFTRPCSLGPHPRLHVLKDPMMSRKTATHMPNMDVYRIRPRYIFLTPSSSQSVAAKIRTMPIVPPYAHFCNSRLHKRVLFLDRAGLDLL